MSRDFYSYDPQDTRDAAPRAPRSRTATLKPRKRGQAEDREIHPATDREAPEPRERSVLKPEREDSPRAYYVRDRAYLLRESEIHTLSEVGRFRVVAPRDLAKYGYAGDSARMERDIRRLKEQSLLTEKTLEISRKKTLRVLTLTKQGQRLLRKTQPAPRRPGHLSRFGEAARGQTRRRFVPPLSEGGQPDRTRGRQAAARHSRL